jgi:hypothetical protein
VDFPENFAGVKFIFEIPQRKILRNRILTSALLHFCTFACYYFNEKRCLKTREVMDIYYNTEPVKNELNHYGKQLE